MTAPERLTLDLPHLRFAALAWGPKDGRLMLCLHGYPDSAWTWRHLGPHFAAQGFRVVAPFMRGYAPTELARDGDYGLGALMYDAVTLHEALGGTGDASWSATTGAGWRRPASRRIRRTRSARWCRWVCPWWRACGMRAIGAGWPRCCRCRCG